VKFERLLKLKKEFLPKLRATSRDSSLRWSSNTREN
jgi:hypothetical protein